jgi:DNA-binding winged helix-turn-helix (wHTH) protein/TolB-like protein/tetratricopeptide (TPR) repeat protein
MIDENSTVYGFEGFSVDPHRRVLLRDGQPVPLTSKAFDLLLALIESEGRELTKDELMERIWANQIVEDANLTVTMAQVRKALGEKASEHRFIVTIPGRGYRWVGKLKPPESLIIEQQTRSQIIIEQDEAGDAIIVPTLQTSSVAGMQASAGIPGLPAKASSTRALPEVFSRRLWLIAGAAAVALLAIAFGAYYFWTTPGMPSDAPQIKSIAVLPFKPLVEEGRDESLELGMADTLIARLSNIREVSVRPISSVRKYGALEQDPIAAGREQRVDAVLDGQIQKFGEKVRVTVRLLRVTDGTPIWASQFDEKMTDIFAVQDSISERVTAALALKLSSEEQRELTKRHTADVEAYQLYLKGRYHLNRVTDDGFFKGRDYFQQAIDKDPNYALAYAGLADAHIFLGDFDVLPPKETFPKAKQAASQALKLDENLAEAHVSLANARFLYDWDWTGSEDEYKRAIAINPGYSDAHQMYSYYLSGRGRFDEALREMQWAQELDPLSLAKITGLGDVLYMARRDDEAIVAFQKTLEMDPNFGFAHWTLGRAYAEKGMYAQAIASFQKAISLSGDSPDEPAELGRAYARSGRKTEARKILDDLKEQSKRRYIAPCVIAALYASLGEKDQAFVWLDKAYDAHDFILVLLKVEPMFDNLRSDSRFTALVKRVGLES